MIIRTASDISDLAGYWVGKPDRIHRYDFLGGKTNPRFLPHLNATSPETTEVRIWGALGEQAVDWVALAQSVACSHSEFVSMELGGGWGAWSVAAALMARKTRGIQSKLFVIEASVQNYARLVEHFRANGISPLDHEVRYGAVGNADVTAYFPRETDEKGRFGRAVGSESLGDSSDPVPMYDARRYIGRVPRIDFLHIDIQGGERSILDDIVDMASLNTAFLVLGTHSSVIHEHARELLIASPLQIWIDLPFRSRQKTIWGDIQFRDGAMVAINPMFVPECGDILKAGPVVLEELPL
jgi:FkbM family methyltransferase